MKTTAPEVRPFAAGTCRSCQHCPVYAPRWCCANCYDLLSDELKRAVWSVADLPAAEPDKTKVASDCLDFLALVRATGKTRR